VPGWFDRVRAVERADLDELESALRAAFELLIQDVRARLAPVETAAAPLTPPPVAPIDTPAATPPTESPATPPVTSSTSEVTVTEAKDGTQYASGPIDPQPEAPVVVPPAPDEGQATTQYPAGQIDDPATAAVETVEQQTTQYPEPPPAATAADPPDTQGL
jgi:hypothetical protein